MDILKELHSIGGIMNKKEVLKTLKEYELNKDEIIILSTAALVLKGIKENCNDIDIAVSEEYYKELFKYRPKLKCEKVYTIDDKIDFGTNYYDSKAERNNGYLIQTPLEVLKLKEKLNRTKDKQDINLINNYLNVLNKNILSLAYLGDAVYEVYIRNYLLKDNLKVKDLQNKAINYVSAKAQSSFLDKMIEDKFLNHDELEMVKRGRNHKVLSHPKNTDIVTYKKATGLEALIGFLYLTNKSRLNEIMKYIVGE